MPYSKRRGDATKGRRAEAMSPMRFLPSRQTRSAVRVPLALLSYVSNAASAVTRTRFGGDDRERRSPQRGETDVGLGAAREAATGRRARSPARRVERRDSSNRVVRITTTARRIAHAHNCCGPVLGGGLLAFDSEGRGGAWYSGRFWPSAAIVYPVGPGRITARDVQAWLDKQEGGK